MKYRQLTVAMLLAFCSLAVTQAQAVAPAAGGVLLKYKFTQGQVLRYRSAADSTATTFTAGESVPTTSHVTTDSTQTVKSIDPATGDATLHVQTAPPAISVTVNGKAVPIPPAEAASGGVNGTVVVSPIGKPVSMSISGAVGSQMAAAGFDPSTMFSGGLAQYSAFPDHAVKVGDVWRSAIPFAQAGGTMYVKQSLIGLSTSGGHTVAEIASRYSMDFDMSPAASGTKVHVIGQETGTGKEQFDVDTGTISSMALTLLMKMNTLIKMPAGMPAGMGPMTTRTDMSMTMHMNRVGS